MLLKTSISVKFDEVVEEGQIVGVLRENVYLINFPQTRGHIVGSIELSDASEIYEEFNGGEGCFVLNPQSCDAVDEYSADLAGITLDEEWDGGLFEVKM